MKVVAGWTVDPAQRERLLGEFPPAYKHVVANHVTLQSGRDEPPGDVEAVIVGHVDDGAGVEAMVVEIDGTTVRPGGGTYHITWSLAEGRKAKESNDAIAARGWVPIAERRPVKLTPGLWTS